MVGRSIRVAAGAAALVLASVMAAPAAFAGEVNGKGKDTPIGEYRVPASICAFSGLNDVPDGSDAPGDPFAAGKVQSFGDIVQQFATSGPGAVRAVKGLMQENKPGISCNKNSEMPHEE